MADKKTTLPELLDMAVNKTVADIHTMYPAIVTRVNISEQLIDAQITIKRKFKGELVNLPLLVDVPIRYPRSKTFSFTFPIEVDDHVEVRICSRSIDRWLLSGGINDPFDVRKFSLADCFATPAMYPQTDLIPGFDENDLQIKTNSGGTNITIHKAEGVTINTTADVIVNASGQTEITSAFTTINNDVLINGSLEVQKTTLSHLGMSTDFANFNSHNHAQGGDSDGDTEQDTSSPINGS